MAHDFVDVGYSGTAACQHNVVYLVVLRRAKEELKSAGDF
jgi:hypothetical protein